MRPALGFGLWAFGRVVVRPAPLHAADKTTAGEFITEPPTLLSLGFEWRIDGDDNRNARSRSPTARRASRPGRQGLPLLRIGNERINENALQYMTPNGFAGSIFDLEPGTDYEARFVLSDPDGVERQDRAHRHGAHARRTDARCRRQGLPRLSARLQRASRQEPAFTGLLAAYYTGSSHSDNFNTFPPRVQPGDTILVHAGVYKDDRYRYGGGLGTVSSGTYFLTQSGTAEKPIVIKAAGDGEAIFDGDGAYNLFNVMAANYNYFEGLTIRNTELAFQGGLKNITGSSGLTIKRCRFENVGRAIYTDWSGSKDYYIADNVMIGRFNPELPDGIHRAHLENLPEFNPKLVSEYAVKVYGSGHVVAYNSIANFHDGVDVATYGNPDGSSERRSAIGCRSRSTSTATTSPTSKTTASKPTAAPTTSASSATAASTTATARSACSRCSAGRCTSSATSSTTRPKAAR